MEKYKYKFSVVIPVYNVEEYLSETIDSVINQTIGFKENIQIILVNDGSPDNSEEICLKYKELYPENIIYVKQKNAGVSAARNKGLEYVEGEFINFLDSDDIWELDVFEKAYNMYKNHEEIDVIGVRQKYFEALDFYPSLDFKFNKDKVVDIFNEYDHIQLSVTSGFFRTSSIGDVRYDTRVKYSEDAKFLIEIILKKEKLGIISSSLHLYRKRFSETSAIQTKNEKDDWYTITPELCYKYVYELSEKKYGYVIPYVQYYVMYDYQWRIKERIPSCISDEVIEKYMEISKYLAQKIDDYIIWEQRNITSEYKAEFLSFKYGENISKQAKYIKHKLYFNNRCITDFTNQYSFKLTSIDFKDDKMNIKGTFNCYIPKDDYKLVIIKNNNEKIKVDFEDTNVYPRTFFKDVFITNKGFSVDIPIKDLKSIRFQIEYKGHYLTYLKYTTTYNCKIATNSKIYYTYKDKIFYYYKNLIKVKDNTLKNRLKFSARNIKHLLKLKKYNILFTRMCYSLLKKFNKKEIWLLADRLNVANDNAEHLFKYINNQNNDNINLYFVIDKKCNDYKRLKEYGNVINYHSFKFKLYFLLADKIISSQADDFLLNPYGKEHMYVHDLYKSKIVFLQHGIIYNDLSPLINKYQTKLDMFVTSVQKEYDSIVNGNYGYGKDVVKLTGLPRYDNLNNNDKKIIAIMPTWRANLVGKYNPETKSDDYNQNFTKSDYYKFYNRLINDKKLHKIMQKKGYKGIFVVHPRHQINSIDFEVNDNFEIVTDFADYQKIFNESSLLITDYSSVAFDFSYLKKPIIYCQFDIEKFYESQFYDKGYFDFEKDSFGPITYDYESSLNKIIDIIENECKLEDKYAKRINSFYKYNDKNNSERVYNEILKLNNKE